jgi:hypothetical protein
LGSVSPSFSDARSITRPSGPMMTVPASMTNTSPAAPVSLVTGALALMLDPEEAEVATEDEAEPELVEEEETGLPMALTKRWDAASPDSPVENCCMDASPLVSVAACEAMLLLRRSDGSGMVIPELDELVVAAGWEYDARPPPRVVTVACCWEPPSMEPSGWDGIEREGMDAMEGRDECREEREGIEGIEGIEGMEGMEGREGMEREGMEWRDGREGMEGIEGMEGRDRVAGAMTLL